MKNMKLFVFIGILTVMLVCCPGVNGGNTPTGGNQNKIVSLQDIIDSDTVKDNDTINLSDY